MSALWWRTVSLLADMPPVSHTSHSKTPSSMRLAMQTLMMMIKCHLLAKNDVMVPVPLLPLPLADEVGFGAARRVKALLRVLLLRRSWSAISLDPRRASHPILLAFLLRLLLPLFRTSQPGTTGHLVTGQYGLVLGADNSRVRRGEAKAPSCLWFLQF